MEIQTNVAGPVRILIVEDSATQALRLKYFLEQRGYRLSTARNGREALAAIHDDPPTLVISDVVMPEMDGYQLCRHLKQDEQFKAIPVILLTSLSDPVDVMRGLECGADNFVFKPYEEESLLARVAYLLANRHLRESESTKMGVEILFSGRRFFIRSDRLQILNLLLSTYEAAVQKNRDLANARDALKQFNETLEARVKERTAALEAEIAERRHAEEKIREQAALLDKAQDAIMVRDLEGRVIYWNKSAERVYGWTAGEAIGQNADQLLFKDESPQRHPTRQQLLERGEWVGELRQVTKDGKPMTVESRWTLVRDSAGQPKWALVINTDITEKKKLEAQFLRAQRLETLGALAGGIAHDLNNALAPIMMGVELLREDLPAAARSMVLDTMTRSARRGSEMVKQIVAFARGVSGEPAVLDVKDLVTEMDKLARQTFPRSVRIQSRITQDLYPVAGNATQLHQVLLNLCVNARDAMPEGGTLHIEADNVVLDKTVSTWKPEPVSGPHVVLRVSDTGCGMTPEVLSRVFEPFFTTKEIGKGTGLGLSTVQGIVKSHGGFLEVASEVGKGTTFKIYLPSAAAAQPQANPTILTALPSGNGEQILVVDDDIAILEMTRETLEAFNYRVLMAKDGAEAIVLYQRHKGEIHAVISDMMMPVMDGPTAIDALRKIDPAVKVIGVSGLGPESVLTKGGELSVQVFLKKPFTTELLLTTLRQLLEARVKT